MNSYYVTLKEARDLRPEECDEYFDQNFPPRTGIYQLCKGCKHPLLKHATWNKDIVLGKCRSISCRCGQFK